MKKTAVIILSVLYMAVTCGVSVNFHYCMGKLRGTYLGYSQKDQCTNCGMAIQKQGCCHDHSQWLKVDDNHHSSGIQVSFHPPVIDILKPEPIFLTVFNDASAITTGLAHAPPDVLFSPDLNILNCVFRI